jgi:hypothetical protein
MTPTAGGGLEVVESFPGATVGGGGGDVPMEVDRAQAHDRVDAQY